MVWLPFNKVFISIGNQCHKDLNDSVVILDRYLFIISMEAILSLFTNDIGIYAVEVVTQLDVLAQVCITWRSS